MGKIKVRYYVVYHRSGHSAGYWKPSRTMREAGFALVNCGENGPAAWKIADEWNRRWDEFRKSGELVRWPIGSVGAAFAAFRQTGVWHAKKPRTKEDWERGWKYIEEPFGDIEPQMIVLAQIDNWYRSIVGVRGCGKDGEP
jgi:hypothetical protein